MPRIPSFSSINPGGNFHTRSGVTRRGFLAAGATAIGISALGLGGYVSLFRPDRDLDEAQYHVFVQAIGANDDNKTLHFNVMNFQTGEPIATGTYTNNGKTEQEQLRHGASGQVFFKLSETNVKKGWNTKEETAKIASGIPDGDVYPNLITIKKDNQYYTGGTKAWDLRVREDSGDTEGTSIATLLEGRGKFTGFRSGMKLYVGEDNLAIFQSQDSDALNWFGGMEADEGVSVYGGNFKYKIDIDHAIFDVAQHPRKGIWDIKAVRLLDNEGNIAASISIDDNMFLYNQPMYVFKIGDKVVGRIIRDERIVKQYNTEHYTDGEGESHTTKVEDKSKRETSNGLYMLEGTDPVACSMVLTLASEKLVQLGFDYKSTWIDFGLDLLKLSLNPNNPEFAMHPAMDVNLTPHWISESVQTIFGYKAPEFYSKYVNWHKSM